MSDDDPHFTKEDAIGFLAEHGLFILPKEVSDEFTPNVGVLHPDREVDGVKEYSMLSLIAWAQSRNVEYSKLFWIGD